MLSNSAKFSFNLLDRAFKEVNNLDAIRRKAVQRVSPQSVPEDVREVIEQTKIQPSLLEQVKQEQNNSLLSKGE